MNAETLHAIALAVKQDLEITRVRELMTQLLEALDNQVNQPAEPTYQEQVGQALTELRTSLPSAPSNQC